MIKFQKDWKASDNDVIYSQEHLEHIQMYYKGCRTLVYQQNPRNVSMGWDSDNRR